MTTLESESLNFLEFLNACVNEMYYSHGTNVKVRIENYLAKNEKTTFDMLPPIVKCLKSKYALGQKERLEFVISNLLGHERFSIAKNFDKLASLLEGGIPYRCFSGLGTAYFKKLSPAQKVEIIVAMVSREYNEDDVKVLTSSVLEWFSSERRDYIPYVMHWLIANVHSRGTIPAAKKIYDMASPEDKFGFLKKVCSHLENTDLKRRYEGLVHGLVLHMLCGSTPAELPGARDVILNTPGWPSEIYRLTLERYSVTPTVDIAPRQSYQI